MVFLQMMGYVIMWDLFSTPLDKLQTGGILRVREGTNQGGNNNETSSIRRNTNRSKRV